MISNPTKSMVSINYVNFKSFYNGLGLLYTVLNKPRHYKQGKPFGQTTKSPA